MRSRLSAGRGSKKPEAYSRAALLASKFKDFEQGRTHSRSKSESNQKKIPGIQSENETVIGIETKTCRSAAVTTNSPVARKLVPSYKKTGIRIKHQTKMGIENETPINNYNTRNEK
ncbi:hypothetical protein EVAR_19947_1 [Eumeta japonica]|uniref:Uncharacterized protein n=1 Tax=Eumeta variegata TaxID=151549 RepID=A0A4C1YGU6_EUMVA|nr:hypothetical protein EVAR_19947_1 [Eumeta japonica]